MHLAKDCESCKCDVLQIHTDTDTDIMQKKKGRKESSREGRSQGYRKMLPEMVILLVGLSKSLLLSKELMLSEVDCPCLCQSWVSFQMRELSQKLPVQ